MVKGTAHGTDEALICPVRDVLAVLGDKWPILVLRALRGKTRRFSELRKDIPDVSQRMLTQTLRALERDGILSRHVTPTIPPRVDYAQTDFGRSLMAAMEPLIGWANTNRAQIARSRSAYDRTCGQTPAGSTPPVPVPLA